MCTTQPEAHPGATGGPCFPFITDSNPHNLAMLIPLCAAGCLAVAQAQEILKLYGGRGVSISLAGGMQLGRSFDEPCDWEGASSSRREGAGGSTASLPKSSKGGGERGRDEGG